MNDKVYVRNTKTMGRGLFATKLIKKGQVIEASPCIILEGRDYDKIQDSKLRFYVFETTKSSKKTALALGIGSLFNHSFDNHNVTYRYDRKSNKVVFKATQNILKGEQLFINYGYDPVKESRNWDLQKAKEETPESTINPQCEAPGVPCDIPEVSLDNASKKLEDYNKKDVESIRPFWNEQVKKPNVFDRFWNFLAGN